MVVELKEARVLGGPWLRMRASSHYEGAYASRVVYCGEDPRSDPAMLAGLKASLSRYIADELGVPADHRDADWAARFVWEYELCIPDFEEGPE